jgi:hypothetical protein
VKIVASNAFGSPAKSRSNRVVLTAVGKALQDVYAGSQQDTLPKDLLTLARRVDEQTGKRG